MQVANVGNNNSGVIMGMANLLLDFGDAKVIQNEAALANTRVFGFQIANSSGSNQKVFITPGYLNPVPDRVIRDGAIPFATNAVTLQCASTGDKTVKEFLAWIAQHPTRILWLQIESTHTQQLTQQLVIQTKNFLDGDAAPEKLTIGSFKSPNYNNDKLLQVKKPNWQFDVDTETSVIVPGVADTTVTSTFTFYFGGTFNQCELPWKLGNAAMAAGIIKA